MVLAGFSWKNAINEGQRQDVDDVTIKVSSIARTGMLPSDPISLQGCPPIVVR
jgi:hypothetical protein